MRILTYTKIVLSLYVPLQGRWCNIGTLKLCWFSDRFCTQLPLSVWVWMSTVSDGGLNPFPLVPLTLSCQGCFKAFLLYQLPVKRVNRLQDAVAATKPHPEQGPYLPAGGSLSLNFNLLSHMAPGDHITSPSCLPQRKTWKAVWHTTSTRCYF